MHRDICITECFHMHITNENILQKIHKHNFLIPRRLKNIMLHEPIVITQHTYNSKRAHHTPFRLETKKKQQQKPTLSRLERTHDKQLQQLTI